MKSIVAICVLFCATHIHVSVVKTKNLLGKIPLLFQSNNSGNHKWIFCAPVTPQCLRIFNVRCKCWNRRWWNVDFVGARNHCRKFNSQLCGVEMSFGQSIFDPNQANCEHSGNNSSQLCAEPESKRHWNYYSSSEQHSFLFRLV